ncbi:MULTISPECIES: YjbF family lipoprotein [unclassified Phaeobacter]|uniref:YjbF family lipoprotein n=1 Tax=unclassified Phaeobacter TaxID=2621772 RepID=UPI003A844650
MTITRQLHHLVISSAAIGCLILAACTNDEREILTLQQLRQGGLSSAIPHVAELAEAGAEQMQVGFLQTGRSGVMLRETERAGLVTWLSSDGASLQTDRGLLHATRGFGIGLMAVEQDQSRGRIFTHAEGPALRFHSYLTGNDQIETRTYHCEIKDRGPRTLTIGDQQIASRLMVENCQNPEQRFLNLYWLRSSDNRLIQSRQWTGPFIGNMTTRLRVTP